MVAALCSGLLAYLIAVNYHFIDKYLEVTVILPQQKEVIMSLCLENLHSKNIFPRF